MSKGKKVVYNKDGYRVEQILSWPESAKLYHQGWCTATEKEEFDDHINRGDLYVLYKPSNRNNRPSYQMHFPNSYHGCIQICKSGNEEVEVSEFLTEFRFVPFLSKKIREFMLINQQIEDSRNLEGKTRLRYVGKEYTALPGGYTLRWTGTQRAISRLLEIYSHTESRPIVIKS